MLLLLISPSGAFLCTDVVSRILSKNFQIRIQQHFFSHASAIETPKDLLPSTTDCVMRVSLPFLLLAFLFPFANPTLKGGGEKRRLKGI